MDEGVALIKAFEGCHLAPYLCPAGLPTIGWGHLITSSEFDQYGVTKLGSSYRIVDPRPITQEEADALLDHDTARIEAGIARLVTAPLTVAQAGALLSWTFNLGLGNLQASTLRRVINRGDHHEAPKQIKRWNKVKGVVKRGLVRRREAEAQLYASG